jgi:hypothetical protein
MKLYDNFINDGTLTNFYGGKTDSGYKLQINQNNMTATPEKVIKALEDIIDNLNRTNNLMQKRIEHLDEQLVIARINAKPKVKYPTWLWNLIYFLAGIGFWQTLLWLL